MESIDQLTIIQKLGIQWGMNLMRYLLIAGGAYLIVWKVLAPKLKKYRHFKGGEYRVHGVARHSETGEQLVVYEPLYGESGLWVRPLSMFQESVLHEGRDVPRFQYLEPE